MNAFRRARYTPRRAWNIFQAPRRHFKDTALELVVSAIVLAIRNGMLLHRFVRVFVQRLTSRASAAISVLLRRTHASGRGR